MLNNLSINNYVLIQQASLAFDDGFTVITGETGAGKSILLGALGLITGKRADSSSANNPSQKCVIEAIFDITNYGLHPFFETHDLDYEDSTIVRREILPSGKSRAFINDTPVNLSQLQSLGARLIDIHSQHKTMDIIDATYQFDIVDTYANNNALLKKYQQYYQSWKTKRQALEQVLEQKKKAQLEFDYQSFLFNELEAAHLVDGEFENLEQRLHTLSHAEEIREYLCTAKQQIDQDEIGVIDLLAQIRSGFQKMVSYGQKYQDFTNRIQSVFVELEDISEELENSISQIESDPQTLEQLNNRVQMLYNLMQKHQVNEVSQLIKIKDELDASLFEVQNVDGKIAVLEKEIAFAKAEALKLSSELNIKRKSAVPSLSASIHKILISLGLPNAQLIIDINSTKELSLRGSDDVSFLFSANKGVDPKPLNKGASGGELSRVMLAIKAVVSRHKKLPTLIFDEIDTGVSGEIALKMGSILKNMGHTMQLMSITHLPQIAGQGDSHFRVYKSDHNEQTATQIVKLTPEDRVAEIAGMLGGIRESSTAIEHAKNLLN